MLGGYSLSRGTASGFPQAVEQGLREPAPRCGEGLADGLWDSLAVATLAVSAEDVERLEAGERLARRLEPQERVDADRLVGGAEVAGRAKRVAGDEDSLRREPKRHLLPEPASDDRDHLERRVGHSVEGRHVERDAEASCDGRAVALVAVEQLDRASRLTELSDPPVDPGAVEDVRQPHGIPDSDRVRGALEAVAFRRPAEAVLELVDEAELHGETMPVAERNDISNAEVADRLESFGSLLELSGAQPYAPRAYRRAAEMIRETKAPIADLVRAGRARELRGIGPGIEARLRELVETGRIAELDELERDAAPELVGLGRLLGFGPKLAVEIGRVLGMRTVDELRAAAAEGRLAEVPGIGPKTEAKLRAALAREELRRPRSGMLLNRARALLDGIAQALGGEMAGDPRRWRDVNEELAVVCSGRNPEPVLERFEGLAQIVAIVERSERRAVGVTVEGVPVELVVAEPGRFGTELVRGTGSRAYVDALEPLPPAADEDGVYATLGIPFCPPELREEPFRGEPPPLVELGDIRGDLHVHTDWSDGKATVLEMGEAALARGYEYLAICDHTRNVRVVPGLDADDVRRQGEEIAAANELLAPFRIQRGIECDILPDGSLDLPDDVLAELEWVQASVHAGQRAPAAELTKRTIEAMRHPAVRCLSHPKGRIINHRPENALDLERVFEVALETGVALEVNGLAPRLDLRDVHVRAAVDAGVPIVCSTDAHSVRGLGNMQLTVATARRGWATAANILNTRPLSEIARR
jgi:DNA polymerase (family X)